MITKAVVTVAEDGYFSIEYQNPRGEWQSRTSSYDYCDIVRSLLVVRQAFGDIEVWTFTIKGETEYIKGETEYMDMEVNKNRILLHQLWTKAVGTPGYDKKQWMELDINLLDMERHIKELEAELGYESLRDRG